MKCPKCQSDMVASNSGWICYECGHLEVDKNAKAKQETSVENKSSATPSQPSAIPALSPTPIPDSTKVNAVSPAVSPSMPGGVPVSTVGGEIPASSRRSWRTPVVVTTIVAVLFGGIALAYKAYVYDPQYAPLAYLQKTMQAKTGALKISGTINSSGGAAALFGEQTTVTANGVYDVSDEKNPKFDAKINFLLFQKEVGVSAVAISKVLYLKLGNIDALKNTGINLSPDWYTLPLAQEEAAKCAEKADFRSGNYFGVTLPSKLPLENTKRVGLFETIEGRRTSHFAGKLSMDKLQTFVDEANKDLAANCKIKFNKDDYKQISLTYDLWTSKDFDRIVLKIDDNKSKITAVVTIDGSSYNKAVKIEAPVDIQQLGGVSGPAASAQTPEQTRDLQRKSDIAIIAAALEKYAAKNKRLYPATLDVLAKDKSSLPVTLPTDPATKKNYLYSVTKNRSTYTISAKLENAADPDAKNGFFLVSH